MIRLLLHMGGLGKYLSLTREAVEKGITKSDIHNHLSGGKQLSLDRVWARLQKHSAFTQIIKEARTLATSNINMLCEELFWEKKTFNWIFS